MNNAIFKLLNPLSNDELSKLDTKTKEQMLKHLKEYLLEYREILSIPEYVTIGAELEFDNIDPKAIKKQLSKHNLKTSWITKEEPSIKEGGEVVSPVLTNTKENWINLKTVCDILKNKANNSELCSSHVHIGRNILPDDINIWENFIYLWTAYEHIIFRFYYGEFLTPRPNILQFASPVRTSFQKKYNDSINKGYTLAKLIEELSFRRELAINFKNVDLDLNKENKNTIELRCPNGTFNETIWQNNINLFIHLLLYSKNINFDLEKIEKQNKRNSSLSSNIGYYNEIYLNEALELADLIFNSNTDKIYFLKQYLKNFEISYEPLKPAKTFTK